MPRLTVAPGSFVLTLKALKGGDVECVLTRSEASALALFLVNALLGPEGKAEIKRSGQ